ncbi:MAG: DUF6785 family protein [Candidatus Hodarchaeales archaeon]
MSVDTEKNAELINSQESISVEGEKPKSGLTKRSLSIGLAILLFWGLISIFAGNFGGATNIFIEEMSILFPFFLLIFGLQALERIRIRGLKLTRQELTFIWGLLVVGIPITNSGFLAGRLILNATYPLRGEPPPPSGFAPSFWGPTSPTEYYRAFDGGGFPDISQWLIPLTFWAITSIAWAFMCLFLIQIFRKPWIDVERLAFPLAQPVQELLEAPLALPNEKKKRFSWLAIGALLGIIWSSFEFLRVVYPEWGDFFKDIDIFGIRPGRAWAVRIDIGEVLGLSAFLPNAYLESRPEPVMIAVFMLVSLNVLLSGLVFYGLFWVFIPIFETVFGDFTGVAPPTGPPWASPPDIDLGFAKIGGMSLFTFGEWGILFGCALWAIILQRRYLWRTIKAIWDPSVIDESNEPIPYRVAWIGLLTCSLIYLVSLLLSNNFNIIGGVYAVLFLLVAYVAGARLRAETAGMGIGHPGYVHLHGIHSARVLMGVDGDNKPLDQPGFYVTALWIQFFQRDAAPAAPAISSLEAYNIARITKTRTRDIFISHSIAVVSIILLCLIVWPIFAYFYGLSNEWSAEAGHNFDYTEAAFELVTGGNWDFLSYRVDIWGQAILGMVFAIGLNIIRLSSPWLPLNPIAAPILMSLRGGYWWLPMLIAYLVKYVTVRIGGTKAYTSYLLPAAVGYLLGTAGIWGFSLIAVMVPAIFPTLLFDPMMEFIFLYGIILLIWALSIIGIIAYIIKGVFSN